MKKKLMLLGMMSLLLVGVVACGNENDKESQDATATEESSVQQDRTEPEESKSESQETDFDVSSEETSERTLEDVEKYMLDNGAVSGERTQMAAEMVGGIAGFKYSDSGVEIYEYDVNTEEYISLSNGEEIPLQGMDGFTVGAIAINGRFVLMGEPSQEAIDTFNSFR